MNTKYTLPLYIALILQIGTPALDAQVIASDNFSDGNRAGWFAAQSGGTGSGFTADASSNALVFNPAADNLSAYLFTYFPSTSLSVGQTLTVSFDFTVSTSRNALDAFRIGLLNSAGTTQLTADGIAANTAFTGGYDGYAARTNIGLDQATNNRVVFQAHNDITAANPLIVVNHNSAAIGTSLGNTFALANSTPYQSSFSITRNTTDTTLKFEITGPGIVNFGNTQTVTSSSLTFDTFALGSAIGSSTTPFDSITIDNWRVSVIPEPSSFPALAALIALGFAATRRLRSRGV